MHTWRNGGGWPRPASGCPGSSSAAADQRRAREQVLPGARALAASMVASGRFPPGLDDDGILHRLHAFLGHPEEIVAALRAERVLPVATDLLAQFNPGLPEQGAALRALELIATEVAPALGWQPRMVGARRASTAPGALGADGRTAPAAVTG